MKKVMIFGAKSIALGVCRAVQQLYGDCTVEGFLVSSMDGNPSSLAGLAVREIDTETARDQCVLIATPENIQPEIISGLKQRGFNDLVGIDSRKEASLMERYYRAIGIFPSVHNLAEKQEYSLQDASVTENTVMKVYVAKFYKDKQLGRPFTMPVWTDPLQVGAALTEERVADVLDSTGENISQKNPNYCELTALYWIWKNKLIQADDGRDGQYCGLFHYRRILDLSDEDIRKIQSNDVDVILPYPMMSEPDIREHHSRYVKESDWQAMLRALEELQPEYARAYEEIFSGSYMYNYNLIIAKKQVLAGYCEWLFPILQRTEELSEPKGWERKDRYIGYLGENLLTLYFMYHKKDLKIYHTGRIMLV